MIITSGVSKSLYFENANNITIYNGGILEVGGGKVKKINILGGVMSLGAGSLTDIGSAFNTNIDSGGQMNLLLGGQATSTTIKNGTQTVVGGSAIHTVINKGGVQSAAGVYEANHTTINDGGKQYVIWGANDTRINTGGIQYMINAGSARNTFVSSGAIQHIVSGTAYKSTVYNGGQIIVDGHNSNLCSDTTVRKNGKLTVKSYGSAASIKLMSGASMSIAGEARLYGNNHFSGAVVTGGNTSKRVFITDNLSLGSKTNMSKLHLDSFNFDTLNVNGAGNTIGSFDVFGYNMNFDIRKLSAVGDTTMLTADAKKNKTLWGFDSRNIIVSKTQATGTYELTKNIKYTVEQYTNLKFLVSFNILQGSKKLGITTFADSLTKNGLTYTVKRSGARINLTIAAKAGNMVWNKGKKRGTANCDIFYGSNKVNDIFNGAGGRDVAVYDKTSWGKDSIIQKSGTMTILFKDLKKTDIVKKLSGSTMTITRKGRKHQTISIQDWNNDTHKIVFGGTMKAFDKYIHAAKPTAAIAEAARKEVWKKAGLASA